MPYFILAILMIAAFFEYAGGFAFLIAGVFALIFLSICSDIGKWLGS